MNTNTKTYSQALEDIVVTLRKLMDDSFEGFTEDYPEEDKEVILTEMKDIIRCKLVEHGVL